MQREPVFDAAATLPGWAALPQDAEAALDERVASWIGGGLSLLMWAFATALAIHWL